MVQLPLILWATEARTFTVADPFVWRLHVLFISEFQGLAGHFATNGLNWGWIGFCLPMFLLVPPLVLLFRPATPPVATPCWCVSRRKIAADATATSAA